MHELSVMAQVVESVVGLARHRGAERVLSVRLQVGELTFLSWDQLEFAFSVLAGNEGPLMEDAKLSLEELRGSGVCPACGHEGELQRVQVPDNHLVTPVIYCPVCNGRMDVTEGRDLLIRDIELQLPDGNGTDAGG